MLSLVAKLIRPRHLDDQRRRHPQRRQPGLRDLGLPVADAGGLRPLRRRQLPRPLAHRDLRRAEGLCQNMPAQVGVLGSVRTSPTSAVRSRTRKSPATTGPRPARSPTAWRPRTYCPGVRRRRDRQDGQCDYVPASRRRSGRGCPLGVDIDAVLRNDAWGFTSYTGSPWVGSLPPRGASVSAAPGGRVALSGAGKGHALLFADVAIPRTTQLERATLRVGRLLQDERRSRGKLTRRDSRTESYRLRLRRVAAGASCKGAWGPRLAAPERPTRPQPRDDLGDHPARPADLPRAGGGDRAEPAAPAPAHGAGPRRRGVAPADPGRSHLRCRRDKAGNVNRLEPVRFRVHARRTGLGVTLRGRGR